MIRNFPFDVVGGLVEFAHHLSDGSGHSGNGIGTKQDEDKKDDDDQLTAAEKE